MTKLSKYLNPLTSDRSIPNLKQKNNEHSYHGMSVRSKINKNIEEFKDNASSHKNLHQLTPFSNAQAL